jgi:hypothetical protein
MAAADRHHQARSQAKSTRMRTRTMMRVVVGPMKSGHSSCNGGVAGKVVMDFLFDRPGTCWAGECAEELHAY